MKAIRTLSLIILSTGVAFIVYKMSNLDKKVTEIDETTAELIPTIYKLDRNSKK